MLNTPFYANTGCLNIAFWYPSTPALGPGSRAVIWLQGCLQRCASCLSPELQPLIARQWKEPRAFANEIISVNSLITARRKIEGITLVGGEPLLQFKTLAPFLELIKEAGLTVMIYSGYRYEDLIVEEPVEMQRILSYTDILVDGPYEEDQDHGEMWRGSANQRILFLSQRYRSWEWVIHQKRREVFIDVYSRYYVFIGIPPRGFAASACYRQLQDLGNIKTNY